MARAKAWRPPWKKKPLPKAPPAPPRQMPERITWDQYETLLVLAEQCLKLSDLPAHPQIKPRFLHSLVEAGLARHLPRFRKWCITEWGREALARETALRSRLRILRD